MGSLKLNSFAKRLEDRDHPLLGPNLKALYLCGLWQKKNTIRYFVFLIIHCSTAVFVSSQLIELYTLKNDLYKALNNFSLTTLSIICMAKTFSFVIFQSRWSKLFHKISQEELNQLRLNNKKVLNVMQSYKLYANYISYAYWILVSATTFILIITPILESFNTAKTEQNTEPYPQIVSSWFPFDNSNMPGYVFACMIHISMSAQGAAVLAAYDTSSVSIMTFFKGQSIILKKKCAEIFKSNAPDNHCDFMIRIKECHRHHNFLLKLYKLFDSLLSPVMFLYVLLCSITICCSVVQLSLEETTVPQKIWVVQYSVGQIFQLFLICWHANEVLIESTDIDRAVYASDWWKANVRERKQIVLLAGKLNCPFLLSAGPFTQLSVPTFVSIMKGAYSFFTLFSQFQETN